MAIDILPVHLEFVLQAIRAIEEEKCAESFWRAANIVCHMKTSDSTVVALLKKLTQDVSVLEKDKICCHLKLEISTALKTGGIQPRLIDPLTQVFVIMSMHDIELVYAGCGKSIVLYLRCLYLESLLKLRGIILSGLLLSVVREAIKRFIHSPSRIRLVVRAEDFNTCLYCLNSAAGKPELFLLMLHCLIYRKLNIGHYVVSYVFKIVEHITGNENSKIQLTVNQLHWLKTKKQIDFKRALFVYKSGAAIAGGMRGTCPPPQYSDRGDDILHVPPKKNSLKSL